MKWGIEARNGSWLQTDEETFGPPETALSFDTEKDAKTRERELCKTSNLMWFGTLVKALP